MVRCPAFVSSRWQPYFCIHVNVWWSDPAATVIPSANLLVTFDQPASAQSSLSVSACSSTSFTAAPLGPVVAELLEDSFDDHKNSDPIRGIDPILQNAKNGIRKIFDNSVECGEPSGVANPAAQS